MSRVTHTFALLELSPNAYREIAELLRAAGYYHVFDHDGVIDMHGIGVMCQPVPIVHPPTQETSMIKPTIGRRVWFWPGEHDIGIVISRDQAFDAGVAYVYSDIMINISYVDHFGQLASKTSVPLLQEGDERPAPGVAFCEWMPYQKQTAAGAPPTLHAPAPPSDLVHREPADAGLSKEEVRNAGGRA